MHGFRGFVVAFAFLAPFVQVLPSAAMPSQAPPSPPAASPAKSPDSPSVTTPATGNASAPAAPVRFAGPARTPGRPNPIGKLPGVPQPISVEELAPLFECPGLDTATQANLIDAFGEYRASVTRLRHEKLVPQSIAALGGPDPEARARAEAARQAIEVAKEERTKLDARLLASLESMTREPPCADVAAEIRSSVERRLIADRIWSSALLGYASDLTPIVRSAAAGAGETLPPEAVTILRAWEKRQRANLEALVEAGRTRSARIAAARDERGLKRPEPSEPHDGSAWEQYRSTHEALVREVTASDRETAIAIGRDLRSTLESLKPRLSERAWRSARGTLLADLYRGPFIPMGPDVAMSCDMKLRALREVDPRDDAAIAAIESAASKWRARRDALDARLADAVDSVRATGEDEVADLTAACAPIMEEIAALDAESCDELAPLGVRCHRIMGGGGWRPEAFGLARIHDRADSFPTMGAARGFRPRHQSTPPPRSNRTHDLAPLDAPWLEHLLDRAAATESERATAHALLADYEEPLASPIEDRQTKHREWNRVMQNDRANEKPARDALRAATLALHAAIERADASLFESLRALLPADRGDGWMELRFDLARRDREAHRAESRVAGSTSDVVASEESAMDLVRVIDDEPTLSWMRLGADHGDDTDRRRAIVERLKAYDRERSAVMERYIEVSVADAKAVRAGDMDGAQDLFQRWAEIGKVNRSTLRDLVAVVATPSERASLLRAYGRAAWPAVFDDPAGPMPLLTSSEREALDRVDGELIEFLQEARTEVRGGMTMAEMNEPIWRLDGLRWERDQILRAAALRRAEAGEPSGAAESVPTDAPATSPRSAPFLEPPR